MALHGLRSRNDDEHSSLYVLVLDCADHVLYLNLGITPRGHGSTDALTHYGLLMAVHAVGIDLKWLVMTDSNRKLEAKSRNSGENLPTQLTYMKPKIS